VSLTCDIEFEVYVNFKLFGFPIFRFWAYLMRVILETHLPHWI